MRTRCPLSTATILVLGIGVKDVAKEKGMGRAATLPLIRSQAASVRQLRNVATIFRKRRNHSVPPYREQSLLPFDDMFCFVNITSSHARQSSSLTGNQSISLWT